MCKNLMRLATALLAVCMLSSCVSIEKEPENSGAATGRTSQKTDEDTTKEDIMENYDYPTICGVDISKFSAVYPSGMSTAVRAAFVNMLALIKEATGTSLPRIKETETAEYELVIGTTSRDTDKVASLRAGLGDEGYALVTDGGRLYITGKTDRGTIYGIYSFLEDYMGVRFYSSSCHVVHKDGYTAVPEGLEITFNPVLEYRDSFWYDVIQHGELASQLKINSTFNRGDMTNYGGGVSYAGGFVHTLASLAEMTGSATDRQPCLTDENVYQTVLKNVKKWLKKNPDAKIVSVSQNDSTSAGRGCQCENCKALDDAEGTPMGSLLTFVNRIANAIKDEFPGVYVDTLAYRYTRQAPKTVVPADNVIIRLCSIECCFSHALSDDSCTQNAAFKKDIEEWSAICKHLYIWDYTTDFLYYITPFPNFDVLWENVQFYVSHNVVGLFEQGNYTSYSGEFGELRAYLLAKLLWNPGMTKAEYYAMMDEFLKDYYGEGWQYIKEYITKTCENAARNHMCIYDAPADIISLKNADGKKDFTFWNEMEALWQSAIDTAADDTTRAHVEQSRIQSEYFSLFVNFSKQSERYEELYNCIKKYNITQFREGGAVPNVTKFTSGPKIW